MSCSEEENCPARDDRALCSDRKSREPGQAMRKATGHFYRVAHESVEVAPPSRAGLLYCFSGNTPNLYRCAGLYTNNCFVSTVIYPVLQKSSRGEIAFSAAGPALPCSRSISDTNQRASSRHSWRNCFSNGIRPVPLHGRQKAPPMVLVPLMRS